MIKRHLKKAAVVDPKLTAVKYDILSVIYGLNRIERYLMRFNDNSASLNIFKNVCLTLQSLSIFRCLAIKFYCSQILNLDAYSPHLRPLKFSETTTKCLKFILKNKINILKSGKLYNFKLHIGYDIEPFKKPLKSQIAITLKRLNLPININTIDKGIHTIKINDDQKPIFECINRIKKMNDDVFIHHEGKDYLKLISINEKVFKYDGNKIKEFFKLFLLSQYSVNNKIEPIEIDGKKQQVIAVTQEFVALTKL